MISHPENWIPLKPTLETRAQEKTFLTLASEIASWLVNPPKVDRAGEIARRRIAALDGLDHVKGEGDATGLKLSTSVLYDLVAHGWAVRVDGNGAWVSRPSYESDLATTAKDRVRESEVHARDAQINEPQIREFIREMEVRRLWSGEWVSVFNLMRDGGDLALRLQKAKEEADPELRAEALRNSVKPYLQFVTENSICSHTGLRLVDIWRYFRFTWSTAHKTAPGRRMMILVRDSVAPFHPVIGIACLSSSVVQQSRRDEWIGWHPAKFIERLIEKPSPSMARWILGSLQRSLRAVYLKDFLKEKVLSRRDIRFPTQVVVNRFVKVALSSMIDHHRFPKAADLKALQVQAGLSKVPWSQLTTSPLYRAKRAKAIGRLLGARAALEKAGFTKSNVECLQAALKSGIGRRAIATILREVKAKNIGVGVMDLSVCGAVAPYNSLLGGKLVSLLMVSPEVTQEYYRRYKRTPSLIASSMKGVAVVRPPRLVLLGTTSLYASGSSQYNRIKVPADALGGKPGDVISYLPLGETLGWGSFHFSKETLRLIEVFVARSREGRRVNSIFGEGVSPRLRKIRQGFAGIGLPEDLLRHGSPRLIYMVPLASNFREVLMEFQRQPQYFLDQKQGSAVTDRMADFWRVRWVAGRIKRDGILEAVASNTLDYPVQHGARAPQPEARFEPSLFEE